MHPTARSFTPFGGMAPAPVASLALDEAGHLARRMAADLGLDWDLDLQPDSHAELRAAAMTTLAALRTAPSYRTRRHG